MKQKSRVVLAFVAIIGYILLTAGFFVVLFFGNRVSVPEGQLGLQIIGMLGMIVGTWGGLIAMVFQFNYGTSQGSVDKGETANKLLEKEFSNIPKPGA